MVKIILEKSDLLTIIQSQYKDAQYVTDLDEGFEITIHIPNFQPASVQTVQSSTTTEQIKSPQVIKKQIDLNGPLRNESSLTPEQRAINEAEVTIDETIPNALTLKAKPVTTPGGQMGNTRGMLPRL